MTIFAASESSPAALDSLIVRPTRAQLQRFPCQLHRSLDGWRLAENEMKVASSHSYSGAYQRCCLERRSDCSLSDRGGRSGPGRWGRRDSGSCAKALIFAYRGRGDEHSRIEAARGERDNQHGLSGLGGERARRGIVAVQYCVRVLAWRTSRALVRRVHRKSPNHHTRSTRTQRARRLNVRAGSETLGESWKK